jgi:RNA polymerase sigma-70 factor (ECF subfamily)
MGEPYGSQVFMTTELARESVSDPDWELITRIARDDREAFAVLVERHHRRLLRVCERLLGNPEDARDAVQEVFLKVLRKAGGFRPNALVSTWLYRVAVNHCLNQLRRRRLVRMISLTPAAGEDDALAEPREERPGADREVEARQTWRATRRAIAGLPPSQRTVLVLARFEGLSYREIADTLGITLGAVESRLVRAMRTLSRVEGAQEAAE